MQRELIESGPLTVVLALYLDFFCHKTGVYSHAHVPNDIVDYHVVAVIGWGVSPQGEPYWLCMNDFGPAWGATGYFRCHGAVS